MRLIPLVLLACGRSDPDLRTLQPYDNPIGPGHELYAPQPHRDHPQEIAVDGGSQVWVSLPGTADEPGTEVAWADGSDVGRVELSGASGVGLAMHPGGRWLVVLQRFSNFASLVDTERHREVAVLPMDFYAIEGAFSPEGDRLWVTNRWGDSVQLFAVTEDDGLQLELLDEVDVGANPRDLAISADGSTVAVAALTGGTVTLVDTATLQAKEVDLDAPANGLAWAHGWLVVGTTSASTHHEALAGPDTDGDGLPGDGTPNVNFQDLQNEIAVLDPDGTVAHRYTSDSICCRDYRDVHPADTDRLGDLLPPSDTWIVGGALPEQVVADGSHLWVSYPGSNQLQRFALDAATGQLTASEPVPAADHAPHGLALHDGTLLVAHRLGETLGRYDATTGQLRERIEVGDTSGGAFPATDAEIGELFNHVTAPFTVDGDATCTHCHREGGNIDKALSMPLTAYGGVGSRMTMAYRGAADSRPWFFEAAFDQGNFKPVMNELARIENFCCTDTTLFPDGAPVDCATHPPPECSEPNASSLDGYEPVRRDAHSHPRPHADPTRDAFYVRRASEVIGRTESFGDSVYVESPVTGDRTAVPLDFQGITRALGAFLLAEPRLLPNPNDPDTEAVRRGEALFERADVACAGCHPAPSFAVSTDHNPMDLPLRMGPVVTPTRGDDGTNLDLFAEGFLEAFPQSEQDSCDDVCGEQACDLDPTTCDDLRDVRFGVPPLRGIWDRAPSMLHDGRATGLREVLCTPGHPALLPGEVGFNERDGVVDSHGGTSHLSPREIADLIAFLESL